jgi:hypothetical protein
MRGLALLHKIKILQSVGLFYGDTGTVGATSAMLFKAYRRPCWEVNGFVLTSVLLLQQY